MEKSRLFKIGTLAESLSEIYLKMKGVKIIGNNNNNKYDLIDENNLITIYGVAEVAFFDTKKANSNLFNVGNHENFSIRNVRCHYLSKNESINMELK